MDNPIEKLVGSAMSQIRDSLGMRVFITYVDRSRETRIMSGFPFPVNSFSRFGGQI